MRRISGSVYFILKTHLPIQTRPDICFDRINKGRHGATTAATQPEPTAVAAAGRDACCFSASNIITHHTALWLIGRAVECECVCVLIKCGRDY